MLRVPAMYRALGRRGHAFVSNRNPFPGAANGRRDPTPFPSGTTGRRRPIRRPSRVRSAVADLVRRPLGASAAKPRRIGRPSARRKSTMTMSDRSFSDSFMEAARVVLLKPRTIHIPRWISARHFSITLSELLGHSSFVLVALSYSVNDFVMLRIIAVAGSTAMLFFTYFHPHGRVLWLPFQWNVLFIAINCYRIGKALREEYMARFLSEEFQNLKTEHLSLMTLPEFAKLVNSARVEDIPRGTVVVRQGEMNPYIRLLVSGRVDVLRDDTVTYRIDPGEFISETGLHTGLELEGPVESCCTVRAGEPCRSLRWDRTELTRFLKRNDGLYRSIRSAISLDVVRKLKGQRHMLVDHEVEDVERWTILRKEQSEARYQSILRNVLNNRGHLSAKRDQIQKYRVVHHISDESHNAALAKCGWTPEDYAFGRKKVVEEQNIQIFGTITK